MTASHRARSQAMTAQRLGGPSAAEERGDPGAVAVSDGGEQRQRGAVLVVAELLRAHGGPRWRFGQCMTLPSSVSIHPWSHLGCSVHQGP